MKKILILGLCLILTLFLNAQAGSIIPMIQQSGEYIKLIEEKYEQQVVHLEFDVIKNSNEVYRQMYEGVQYGLILFGDDNFNNFILEASFVEGDDWKVIFKETGEEGIVMLFFTIEKTDFYRFDIISELKEGSEYGYYNLIIFR